LKRILWLMAFILLLIPIKACIVDTAIPSHTEAFYVNDFAQVLSSNTKGYILEQSIKLDELSGAQLVVVTIDSTDGQPLGGICLGYPQRVGELGARKKTTECLFYWQ